MAARQDNAQRDLSRNEWTPCQRSRHTAGSLAINAGESIKAVQRILGHMTTSITLDRYGHLYDEDLITLDARMEQKYQRAA